jgi:hypothetical protein
MPGIPGGSEAGPVELSVPPRGPTRRFDPAGWQGTDHTGD